MKLNTKKTEGEKQKELKKAEQSFKKSMQCALICSSGAGEKITEHFIGCPYFVATEKPVEDWDKDCQICQMEKVAEHPNHKIGVSSTKQSGTKDVTPNLAEYKQKLIKRLKKTRTPMSGKEKNWWIDFNTVKKALDEVEAVIRVSEG